MNQQQILIYGLGGPEKAYRPLEYYVIFDPANCGIINEIWRIANRMKAKNPSVKQIFVMDNRRGLKRDFEEAIRANSIEGFVIFRDMLEREAREIQV